MHKIGYVTHSSEGNASRIISLPSWAVLKWNSFPSKRILELWEEGKK